MERPKIIPREVHFAIHGTCAFATVISLTIILGPMALYPDLKPIWFLAMVVSGLAAFLIITEVLHLVFEPWTDRKIAAANPGYVKKPQTTQSGLPVAVDRAFWLIWNFGSACGLAVGLSILCLWHSVEPSRLAEFLAIVSAAVTYLAVSKGIWRLVKPWARVKIDEVKLAIAN